MKFKAMVDDTDFDGNKIEGFEVEGYLTCEDSEDFVIRKEGEKCEWRIDPSTLEIVKEKRTPDSNGVLPLTSEELIEFGEINETFPPEKIYIHNGCIFVEWKGNEFDVYKYKAIFYLADKFNLNGGE